ncbi:MAG: hypothetical protein M0R30_01135 [Methanoregula sp.]|jgi:hypothetical protein|uniref:hypothetical protein n=1 Tax=Methanoregula sp. TaxID=2052170 RepID=UPI0025F482E7|nr:hypothetical protein [Methanoregula sp.]MCK9630219.1 hypothetical protein [Methanoregula sp.]
MNAEFRLQLPQVYGNRTIIPVVREVSACHEYGMMGSLQPVALLIGEDDQWGIALLEGDSVVALLEKLVLPA